MSPSEFVDYHVPALETDEIKYNLILGILSRNLSAAEGFRFWTLGGRGECAVQTAGWPIVLGALSKEQCEAFAGFTRDLEYSAAIGSGETALWFAAQAERLRISFANKIPQQIQVLQQVPVMPSVPGFARQACEDDFGVFRNWWLAFIEEAVPHDPIPGDEALRKKLVEGSHWLWIVDGAPVSLATVGRRLKSAASVGPVFTPPEHRNKGYAGAATAAAVQAIFSQGHAAACLYTDLRNPASNRCYAKLGFRPVCDSWLVVRQAQHRE